MNDTGSPLTWRKSSYSSAQTNCVEIGRLDGGAAVRDTKDRDAGHLTVHADRWSNFITAIKSNGYDAPGH